MSTCSIFQLEAWPTPRHNQELNKALQNQTQNLDRILQKPYQEEHRDLFCCREFASSCLRAEPLLSTSGGAIIQHAKPNIHWNPKPTTPT